MENFEERWMQVEEMLQERFGKLPDMEGILFLIGINELGKMPEKRKWNKEQKQDLMHVAVCSLLSQSGYYEIAGYDDDGWPHFRQLKALPEFDMMEQETFLKDHILLYFDNHGF